MRLIVQLYSGQSKSKPAIWHTVLNCFMIHIMAHSFQFYYHCKLYYLSLPELTTPLNITILQ